MKHIIFAVISIFSFFGAKSQNLLKETYFSSKNDSTKIQVELIFDAEIPIGSYVMAAYVENTRFGESILNQNLQTTINKNKVIFSLNKKNYTEIGFFVFKQTGPSSYSSVFFRKNIIPQIVFL